LLDNTARVWEVTSGREVARMTHEDNDDVQDVAFSPSGEYLATASWDNTVRLWEVSSGREVARMTHEDPVQAVTFSPNGRYLASASWDGTARLWLWRSEDLIDEACVRVNRNLTQEEWKLYLPGEPYRKTCGTLSDPGEIDGETT
jgi:WD40 repeat protein